MMPSSFHVQLSESFLQRRLNGDDLLGCVVFFHCRLRTGDGFLRCSFVDYLSFQRHVG